MTAEATASNLDEHFGDRVLETAHFRGESTAVVETDAIVDIARYCRDELGYNFLSDLTGVDWLGRAPRFDVVYHLTNLTLWTRFRLKVQVDDGQSVPTVTGVWPAANWAEREVWDLFGIKFSDHPDLRRIQMPEGWIGHPLRKDFAQTQISLPRPKADKIKR